MLDLHDTPTADKARIKAKRFRRLVSIRERLAMSWRLKLSQSSWRRVISERKEVLNQPRLLSLIKAIVNVLVGQLHSE